MSMANLTTRVARGLAAFRDSKVQQEAMVHNVLLETFEEVTRLRRVLSQFTEAVETQAGHLQQDSHVRRVLMSLADQARFLNAVGDT